MIGGGRINMEFIPNALGAVRRKQVSQPSRHAPFSPSLCHLPLHRAMSLGSVFIISGLVFRSLACLLPSIECGIENPQVFAVLAETFRVGQHAAQDALLLRHRVREAAGDFRLRCGVESRGGWVGVGSGNHDVSLPALIIRVAILSQ